MKRISLVLALALAAALAPLSAVAQRSPVRGHVVGDDGKPLAGADIVLVNKDNGQKFTMRTDKNGDFVNIAVALGVYHLTVNKGGKILFEKDLAVSGEEVLEQINIPKAQAERQQEALKQLTPEQRKQIEEQQKAAEAERAKIASLNQMLADAKTAEDSGNYDEAISLYKQATAVDSTKDLLWARLGGAYLGAGGKVPAGDRATATEDYTQAVEAYKKAIAIKGSEAAYHNNLGQAYAKLGKTDEAMTEYNAAATLDPANAGLYYFNLGAILTNLGKVDEANAAFDKAIAADPNRADAYYWKGVNLLSKATLKDNKMVAPQGTAENLNKYLALAPNGSHAESAKELLASIGAKVETSFQKKK
ncbi:MAG TPA: tetratricopeptide repeat protein [Terriglobales bacterium]|nr:tetratricopeptide repeat protein [Terriglobales bacterium]